MTHSHQSQLPLDPQFCTSPLRMCGLRSLSWHPKYAGCIGQMLLQVAQVILGSIAGRYSGGRFRSDGKPLPGHSLTADTAMPICGMDRGKRATVRANARTAAG